MVIVTAMFKRFMIIKVKSRWKRSVSDHLIRGNMVYNRAVA